MEEKKKEFINFLLWMAEAPDVWWKLIEEEALYSTEACRDVIEQLIARGYYILIPIVLGRSRNHSVEKILHKMIFQKIAESWEQKTLEEVSGELRAAIDEVITEDNKRKAEEV